MSTATTFQQPLATKPIDWTAMLAIHGRWLQTVIRARVGDFHVADDLLQELALSVLRQGNRPTEQAKVAPWLYRIALRKVINHQRGQGRRRRMLERLADQVAQQPAAAPPADGHWLLEQDRQAELHEAMKKLSPSDRQILLLKYTEDWTYQQLSDHLGITVKTIEYRLLRARDALRRELVRIH